MKPQSAIHKIAKKLNLSETDLEYLYQLYDISKMIAEEEVSIEGYIFNRHGNDIQFYHAPSESFEYIAYKDINNLVEIRPYCVYKLAQLFI